MDVYFEQSVDNANIDKHRKRTSVLGVVRYIMLIVGVIPIFLLMFTPINTWVSAVIYIVSMILLAAPFIGGFFAIGVFINKSNVEFDYLINGSMFRIVKVMNRKKRKKLVETSISNFESVGRISSDTYDRYAADRDVKKIFAICDFEDEDQLVYIFYVLDGVKYLLHIQPDEEMIVALRQSVTRIMILDKSLKTAPGKTAI